MTDLISPSHYQRAKLETIDTIMDVVRDLPGDEAVLVGNAIKYLVRYRFKEGNAPIVDVQKAEWYIRRLVQLLQTKPSMQQPTQKKEYPRYPVDH
jgi:hypothetical protein|tara:strand:- start:218 stop:502 length:285 start_codon:yes stop_codon:yes gene_type:complete